MSDADDSAAAAAAAAVQEASQVKGYGCQDNGGGPYSAQHLRWMRDHERRRRGMTAIPDHVRKMGEVCSKSYKLRFYLVLS